MNQLTKCLIKELVDGKSVTAIFGGGFKPPVRGHFQIVKDALKEYKDIDKFIIYVGGGERDGITQEQSLKIWEIYKELLPSKVEIIPSPAPIGDIIRYIKNHPDEEIYFIIGYREGREDDLADVAQRTSGIEEKYPNTKVRVISSKDSGMSGTNARKALMKGDKEKFFTYLPDEVPDNEKEEIYNIVGKSIVKEQLTENTIPSIDILEKISELSNHMREKGYKIDPTPHIELVGDDVGNAEKFLGKTAYYNPINKSIVLYTYGRHPKDIVRSFAHEMIHHIQNLEGRLGDISTTNTLEDDHINDLEKEANLRGTMTFRNWTDSLQEGASSLLEEEDRLMADVVNPEGEHFQYQESNIKGLYTYKDSKENLYFARIVYQPTSNPYFEFKAGWFEDNDISKPKYDPQLPPTTIGMDNLKRRNTIAKIYRDEILPYFKEKSSLSNTLVINPISDLRYNFSSRLVKNWTPKDFEVEYDNENKKFIKIFSKTIEEKYKNKDPFGLNQYARELVQGLEEIEDREIKFWALYNDIFTLLKNNPEQYDDLSNKLDGEKLDALNYFWDFLEKGTINEGIYDSIVTKLSREVLNAWKSQFDKDPKLLFALLEDSYELTDAKGRPMEFEFIAKLDFKKTKDRLYKVDGGADEGIEKGDDEKTDKGDDEDDEDDDKVGFIALTFQVDPRSLPQMWETIAMDIRDVLRHEIEHLTQGGWNVRPGKEMEDDTVLRDLIQKYKILAPKNYFLLNKEIDAMLQGLYFKAKKSHKTFEYTVNQYLDRVRLKPEEKEEIKNIWAKRTKALSLPKIPLDSAKDTPYLHNTGVNENGEGMRDELGTLGGKKPVIYCDMDGVLVDFDKGFHELTGLTTHHADSQGRDEFWATFRKGIQDSGKTEEQYWANLEWMPDGKQLWDYIKPYKPYVLSAPSVNIDLPFEDRYKIENNESMRGKTTWIQRLDNLRKLYFRSASRKADFASPNKILIDDKKSTIDAWNANGGVGIFHTSAADTIKQLKELGL